MLVAVIIKLSRLRHFSLPMFSTLSPAFRGGGAELGPLGGIGGGLQAFVYLRLSLLEGTSSGARRELASRVFPGLPSFRGPAHAARGHLGPRPGFCSRAIR